MIFCKTSIERIACIFKFMSAGDKSPRFIALEVIVYSQDCLLYTSFSIWRKINSNQFTPDSCKPGLAGKGYTKIASNINSKNGDIYFYEDDMLDGGNTYCYRILAEFAFTSPGGNSYNLSLIHI